MSSLSSARRPQQATFTVSLTGDIWQSNATRTQGPREISSFSAMPDLRPMMTDYELRHGKCSSFTIQVVQ